MKKKFIFLFLIGLFLSCEESMQENIVHVKTMGTTGTIKFISSKKQNFQKEIDSLLLDVNMSLSTYIDSSTLSKFNSYEDRNNAKKDEHFRKNYHIARLIWEKTNRTFNPGIYPLVQYWKVQNKEENSYSLKVDSAIVKSIVWHVNFKKFYLFKKLDFSALAKGYGVDVVAEFLEEKGIENYMVEIGGEVHCKGVSLKKQIWKIGIEEPNEQERKLFDVVSLKDKSMATSGNYRNFKVLDSGQKIVHIINPKTGYPEISNLLSASVITDNCMEADAYATACMVMGVDTCFKFILSEPDLECYLIYSDKEGNLKTKISSGFKPYLIKERTRLE